MLIDDFAVPDDPGYAFDSYGPNQRSTLEYLLQGELTSLTTYFPSTPSELETGARRGYVVAASNSELVDVLDGVKLLRRWRG